MSTNELPSVFNPQYHEPEVDTWGLELLDVSDPLVAKEAYYNLVHELPEIMPALKGNVTGLLRTGLAILVVGCGEGHLVKLLADTGYDAAGIDINPDLRHGNQPYERKNGWDTVGVSNRCKIADMNDMVAAGAIKPESVDIVTSSNIHDSTYDTGGTWWKLNDKGSIDASKFVLQVKQALKPGGIYFCHNEDDTYLENLWRQFQHIGGFRWLALGQPKSSTAQNVFQKV